MKNRRTVIIVLAVAGIAALLYAAGFGRTRVGGTGAGTVPQTTRKIEPWPTATNEIIKQPDAVTARRVLTQLNSDLDATEQTLPRMSPETVAKLTPIFKPSAEEARDWSAKNFTPMDGNHVGESLFFHAVARSLNLDGLSDEQKAAAAFDWVCRQMYLRAWMMPGPQGNLIQMPAIPPQDALRRGYGTGVEREAAFLALARQLGLDVLLVGPHGAEAKRRYERKPDGSPHRGLFWAVGVRVENDVILFDPWHGEAFPGPDGKGIARLSAAKTTPSLVIGWLNAKKTYPANLDDVTYAATYLAAPLSALTPRMQLLESQLAGPVGVKLAVNVEEASARCLRMPGGPAKWHSPPATVDAFAPSHLLGSATPQIEGGYDASSVQLAMLVREAEPRRSQVFEPPAELGFPKAREEFLHHCADIYKQRIVDPGFRDRIQRGLFNDVVTQLVGLDRTLADTRQGLRNNDPLNKSLAQWYSDANEKYEKLRLTVLDNDAGQKAEAEQAVAALWGKNSPVLEAVQGAMAEPATHEVAYLLALCLHEQAERSQMRYRKAGASEAAGRSAAEDWATAQARWAVFLEGSAKTDASHPGRREQAAKLAARATALAANPNEDRR